MTSLTGRPIVDKPSAEDSKRERYAWVECPCQRWRTDGPCSYCQGVGRLKLPLLRLAAGSKAKGGSNKAMGGRTTIDAKFSLAVRERDHWTCSVCLRSFEDNPGMLDAMHYVPRGYKALRKGFDKHSPQFGCCMRHDLDNAKAGCKSCHDAMGRNPSMHDRLFRDWLGDALCDQLLAQKSKSQKRAPRNLSGSAGLP